MGSTSLRTEKRLRKVNINSNSFESTATNRTRKQAPTRSKSLQRMVGTPETRRKVRPCKCKGCCQKRTNVGGDNIGDDPDETIKGTDHSNLLAIYRNETPSILCSSFIFEEIKPPQEQDSECAVSSNGKAKNSEFIISQIGIDGAKSNTAITSQSDVIKWKRGPIIGSGSFGKVYCGLTIAGELIAVKESTIKIRSEGILEDSVQKEIVVLRSLKHRSIVRYLGTSFVDGAPCLFMEFVPGGTISSILRKFGALCESIVLRYTKQLVDALVYLHGSDVIHRDIKGSNIMLMPNGVIKLIDFGSAKKIVRSNGSVLEDSRCEGTPYWMPPEIINGESFTKKSDVWSVGCTVIEMATGKPPWGHLNQYAAMYAIIEGLSQPHMPDETFSEDSRRFTETCLKRSVGCTVIEMATGKPPWGHLNQYAAMYAIIEGLSQPHMPDKTFSEDSRRFTETCLSRDPHSRPSADSLLQHNFLKVVTYRKTSDNNSDSNTT